MDIHIVAKYVELGYRVKRSTWGECSYLDYDTIIYIKLSLQDLLAQDWEVITTGIVKDFPITYRE
jgi:hypothetical protein